jgi:hypothetical protein
VFCLPTRIRIAASTIRAKAIRAMTGSSCGNGRDGERQEARW